MKRTIALAAAVAMLMVVPATANAAKPEQFKVEGGTASASWTSESGGTTTFTNVFLNVGTVTVGGDSFDDVFFDIFIFEAGEDSFTAWFGFAEPAPEDVSLDVDGGTFSAAVDVAVELQGETCTIEPSGDVSCVDIGTLATEVSVEWDEATGRMYPSIQSGMTHLPFGFFQFHSKSQARVTTATGEISGDLAVVLGESESATIGRDTFTDRFRFLAG